MKSKEEIEKLAELWNDQQTELEFGKPHNAPNRVKSFVQGYTQSQEDMKPLLKTLFALWETLAERGEISVGIDFTKHYEKLKQQLNK